MNFMTGLIRPTQGEIRVCGIRPDHPEQLCRLVGYCAQYDAVPQGLTGYQFIYSYLRVLGFEPRRVRHARACRHARVGMSDAAGRTVAAYSKGMRQRIKLAQAMAHSPQVVVLDEPLNGLDPMARAESHRPLPRVGRDQGRHVIVSSHILHEVDRISDQVILLSQGYVVAEGEIQGVRSEVTEQPMQILVRCDRPRDAGRPPLLPRPHVEAKIQGDGQTCCSAPPTPTASICCSTRSFSKPASRSKPWPPPTTTSIRSTSI
jgi:ABC-2 type transport system ATP-binding protein